MPVSYTYLPTFWKSLCSHLLTTYATEYLGRFRTICISKEKSGEEKKREYNIFLNEKLIYQCSDHPSFSFYTIQYVSHL